MKISQERKNKPSKNYVWLETVAKGLYLFLALCANIQEEIW